MELHFLSRAPKGHARGIVAICPDDLTLVNARRLGIEAALLSERPWLYPQDCLHTSRLLSRDFYRDGDGNDFTIFEGLSLGWALEEFIWPFRIGPALHLAREVDALIRRYHPKRIIIDRGVPAHRAASVRNVSERLRIPLEEPVMAGPGRPSLTAMCRWPLSEHAHARRFLDLLARKSGGARILCSYYPSLEPLIASLNSSSDLELSYYAWPGIRRLKSSLLRWRFLTAPEQALTAGQVSKLEMISGTWRRLAESREYAARFRFGDIDLWPDCRAALDDVFMRDIPQVATELVRLRSALDDWRPALAIVAFDSPPPERLLLGETRRRSIPSILALHGVIGTPLHEMLDTHATDLLVGGPSMADKYAAIGVPRRRIHVTGLLSLDPYVKGSPWPPAPPVCVIILANLLPIEQNIGPLVDLLLKLPDTKVLVKLHGGDHLVAYRETLRGRLGPRVRLVKDAPFADLLRQSHIVVGSTSTALAEAMACKRRIFVTNFGRLPTAPPFDGHCGVPAYETIEALAPALAEGIRQPVPVDYDSFLSAWTGLADGRAGERAVTVVREILRDNRQETQSRGESTRFLSC